MGRVGRRTRDGAGRLDGGMGPGDPATKAVLDALVKNGASLIVNVND